MVSEETRAQSVGRAKALRWLGRIALLLGYLSLGLSLSTYRARNVTVRSKRPELGTIVMKDRRSPSGGIRGWEARFLVDVSVRVAWLVLSDCRNYPAVLHGVATCRLVRSESPTVKVYRMTFTHPEGAWMQSRYVLHPDRYRTSWMQTDGSFQGAEGYIHLKPAKQNPAWTEVTYGYFLAISPLLTEEFEHPRTGRSVRHMANEIQGYFRKKRARR